MFNRHLLAVILISLAAARLAPAEDVLSETEIRKILTRQPNRKGAVSSQRRVLLCWSPADHPAGTHAYEGFAKSLAATLDKVEKISASPVKIFPTDEQWKDADLVVFNLTQKFLSGARLKKLDEHLNRGKSLMVIHQGLVQRRGYDNWADRVGYAFSWDRSPAKSKWGKGDLEIGIDTSHEIFRGFPKRVAVNEELYWNLKKGTRGRITVLGETAAPKSNGAGKKLKWPVFWTVEHSAKAGVKPGRVFCSVIGHFDEVQAGPAFRLVMLRAVAWCLDEPFTPFKP